MRSTWILKRTTMNYFNTQQNGNFPSASCPCSVLKDHAVLWSALCTLSPFHRKSVKWKMHVTGKGREGWEECVRGSKDPPQCISFPALLPSCNYIDLLPHSDNYFLTDTEWIAFWQTVFILIYCKSPVCLHCSES